MNFYRKLLVLSDKNLRIIVGRQSTATIYTALVLPIFICVHLGIGQRYGRPSSTFGIGDVRPIRSLQDGLAAAEGGRNTVALVNGGLAGGDIDRVIGSLSDIVNAAGKTASVLASEDELSIVCRSSFRSTTPCYGAVVFHSSPDEGDGTIWNYTLRGDGVFGISFETDRDGNDVQLYTLPLQRAVDAAIAGVGGNGAAFPSATDEYPFTALDEEERKVKVRREYQQSFVDYLSVGFLIALIGVCYHMPGLIASEREQGLSQLVDAMMPAAHSWERQLVRMMSHWYAFAAVYAPGWAAAAVVCRVTIWTNVSYGIVIIYFVLAGLAITSMTLLGASLFKKAQLSGNAVSIFWLILGIVAQALTGANTATVAVLSLLFTPCNFVWFIVYIARYEADGRATNLAEPAPTSPSRLPGFVYWIFLLVQIIAYPFAAAFAERALHGATTATGPSPRGQSTAMAPDDAVVIRNVTKVYKPSALRRFFPFVSPPRPEVRAVDDLTLTAKKGQILVLLGANGSGKSTTLDAIAGIGSFTSGHLATDTSGGLGIAPQKNVLWDRLTVEEHISIFNRLKSPDKPSSLAENLALIEAVGLGPKRKTQARHLQKIWEILLAERGRRTIILTTHFLDEADLLADRIAILSKGRLRAEGSAARLKDELGAGYRVHVLNAHGIQDPPAVDGADLAVGPNTVVYTAPTSTLAADVIRALEAAHVEYNVSGPTIEEVFLGVAEEARDEADPPTGAEKPSNGDSDNENNRPGPASTPDLGLMSGKPVGFFEQTLVLFRKRLVLVRTNWIPHAIGFLIPVVAAAITQMLVRGETLSSCSPVNVSGTVDVSGKYADVLASPLLVAGPAVALADGNLAELFAPVLANLPGSNSSDNVSAGLADIVESPDNFSSFRSFVEAERKRVVPGGFFLRDDGAPVLTYQADNLSPYTAVMSQNLLDVVLANTSIAASYVPFDSAFPSNTGRVLQLMLYLAIAATLFPGFFGLHPNLERRSGVRGLQYSTGARALPLWTSHAAFDVSIAALAMVIVAAVYNGASDAWYHGGLLFPVFILFTLASVLLVYVLGLVANSAVSTFALATAVQGVGFAIYIIAFLLCITLSDPTATDRNVFICHLVLAAIFPIGSLVRALLVALNAFSTACAGDSLQPYPGAMTAYGAPILYLVLQSLLYFGLLLWHDGGGVSRFGRGAGSATGAPPGLDGDEEPANEIVRVGEGRDPGLRVVRLCKAFGDYTAVDNVTFGVEHGEVFALLGPNGAGKSTAISLIRGDLRPDRDGGDVLVEGTSVSRSRAHARRNLGVCPQFDAIDSHMTVRQHLAHYARLRGISSPDVPLQVRAVVRAVGLAAYVDVPAHTLSGGNKRKLSLGIALTGNPSVILLDEPSSGLDAAAKRVMWRTLRGIISGRSILLTTHSMEEADALAVRVGILSRRMLAQGDTDALRKRFGDTLHVHLVSASAPHTTPAEIDAVLDWVREKFPGAEVEQGTWHGQMRFRVPASSVPVMHRSPDGSPAGSAIGRMLVVLDGNKDRLGISHHSVSPTTLNEVFLAIVGQHDVLEEGYRREDGVEEKKSRLAKILKVVLPFRR